VSEPLAKYVRVDTSEPRVERVWDGVASKLGAPPKTGRRWALRAGMVAVAGVALFVGVRSFTQPPPGVLALRTDFVEAANDARTVGLGDGSRLELAARTKLTVIGNDPSSMQIALDHGRVECDVTPRPERHFAVTAAGVVVRVKGTKFGVELAPARDRVKVDVERGRVEVTWHDGAERRELAAGEHWSIDLKPATPTTPSPTASNDEASSPVPSAAAGVEARDVEVSDEAPSAEPSKSSDSPRPASVPGARELLDLGNAARRAGDIASAVRAYEQLLVLHPSDGRAGLAAFELGRLKMDRLGDVQGAVQALQKAVRLAPGGAFREDAMARLVDAYARAGMTERCRSAQSAYLASYPTGVHASAVERACPKR
jgi:hypothetical protein